MVVQFSYFFNEALIKLRKILSRKMLFDAPQRSNLATCDYPITKCSIDNQAYITKRIT